MSQTFYNTESSISSIIAKIANYLKKQENGTHNQGERHFSLMVKLSVKMPVAVPGCKSGASPLMKTLGGNDESKGGWVLVTHTESWIEFPAPGIGPGPAYMLWAFGQ